MTICIFCRHEANDTNVEHILPESLGGGDWARLPPGVVCGKCNQYFGAKVEAPALGSYPFLPFRVLLGIPTKRRRAPFLKAMPGTVSSSPSPGRIILEPATPNIHDRILRGEITQLRLLAEPSDPVAVCRLLLKMGLEVIGADAPSDARLLRFDAAREFARSPRRNQRWWFLVACDHQGLFRRFERGVSRAEWRKEVSLSTYIQAGVEVFHLRLLNMSLITPLEPAMQPAEELRLNEPSWRLFEVQV